MQACNIYVCPPQPRLEDGFPLKLVEIEESVIDALFAVKQLDYPHAVMAVTTSQLDLLIKLWDAGEITLSELRGIDSDGFTTDWANKVSVLPNVTSTSLLETLHLDESKLEAEKRREYLDSKDLASPSISDHTDIDNELGEYQEDQA